MGLIEEKSDDDKSPELQGILWTCNNPLSSISISRHTVTCLSFGSNHCLFLTDSGDVFSFGKNDFGQLGSGDKVEHTSIPFYICSIQSKVRAIACGPNHSAALTVDGLLFMWGHNDHGQCGSLKEGIYSPELVEVYEQLGKCQQCSSVVSSRAILVDVACGPSHTLAVTSRYEVFAWGTGPQLGLSIQTRSMPERIDFLRGKKVISVACGGTHSLAVTESSPEADVNDPVVICAACTTKPVTCPLGLPCAHAQSETSVDASAETVDLQTDSDAVLSMHSLVNGGKEGGDSSSFKISDDQEDHISKENPKPDGLTIVDTAVDSTGGSSSQSQAVTSSDALERTRDRAETEPAARGCGTSSETQGRNAETVLEQAAVEPDVFEGVQLRRAPQFTDRLRSASVPVKRTSSIIDPEYAMEFLDRQLGHKPRDKNCHSVPEEFVGAPSRESSSSSSSAVVKNMLTRVTSSVVERLNFVSFTPRLGGTSQNSSAESFEFIDSDGTSKSDSDKTEGRGEKTKKNSRSTNSRKVRPVKQGCRTQVWSWGKGSYGQLGHGDDLDRAQPCLMKHLSESGVFRVSAGHGHSLALTSRFSVLSWGLNDTFQLGHNVASKCMSTPKLVHMPRNELVSDIAAGQSHSLFLVDSGGSQPVMYGCGQHQCESSPYGCQKSKKIFPVTALKKGGLITHVFAGGPSSGCIMDLNETDEMRTLYEFAASERRCLDNMCMVQTKVFQNLVKDGSLVADVPDYACKPLKVMVGSAHKLISLLSCNAYDLTELLQNHKCSAAIAILENTPEWIEAFWSYIKALTNFLAVGGFVLLSRMIVFSPNALNRFAKEIVGDISLKNSQSILLQLLSLPVKRIGEYTRLFSRLLTGVDQQTKPWRHFQSCLNEWAVLSDISSKELALAEATKNFWESVSQKVVEAYRLPNCRMLRDSKVHPLHLVSAGRFASHHFILFNDKFVHCHFGGFQNYNLETAWVEADTESENVFAITTPEEVLVFSCPTSSEKTEWVCSLNQAIRNLLNHGRSENPLKSLKKGLSDGRLVPPNVRHSSYVFTKSVAYKDATYKGSWLKGQLHGSGKLVWSDGRRYTGKFKNNLQHGEGEYVVPGYGGDTVFRGTWKNGKLHGLGSARYPNGDLYEGFFKDGLKDGHGILKEGKFLSSSSIYVGQWYQNKRHGYGVLDNEKEGEKYMGMWQDDCRHGNGIMVTLDDIYYEGNFVNNNLSGHGTMMFQDNTVFKGELGAGGSLNGRGILSLSNGDSIQGSFYGMWSEGIKISGVYQKSVADAYSLSEVESMIHSRDTAASQLCVPASEKWKDIFDHCRDMLGIQGVSDAQDNRQAWDAIAIAISNRKKLSHLKERVKCGQDESLDYLERIPRTSKKQNSLTVEQYGEIKEYLYNAFDCVHHPLGYLLDGLVGVFRLTYCGIGVHPRLLAHAIQEVRSFCHRLYELVRILFPDLPLEDKPLVLTSSGNMETPKDMFDLNEECITPNTLIQPVLLPRLYPSLSTLYALNNEKEDKHYWERLLKWNKQSDLALMTFLGVDEKFVSLKFPENFLSMERNRISSVKDECFTAAIDALQHISTAFTAIDKLQAIRQTFEEINKEVQVGLGDFLWNMDDLFPVFQYVVVRARIRNLGSEIHFVDDLMEHHFQNGELGIMFTTVKACYFQIRTEKLVQT